MKDKATGIAPYHEWDIKIPQKVKDAVIKAQGD